MRDLSDGHGRHLHYLRLSVTDRCNFRCAYCLPDGCGRPDGEAPLSVAEIARLARAFAALGVWKIRLTGGEPTVRSDLLDVVRAVAAAPGVRRIGLTTNGDRLEAMACRLQRAGLTSVNVSVDSLDPDRFERITGRRRLDRVVAGVEAALDARIPSVKVNAVLLRGMGEDELDRFLAWASRRAVTVRFIELMQTRDNVDYFRANHVEADELRTRLERRGWRRRERDASDGPAITFDHPAHAGQVGIVAPYSPGFCASCNRVRVSSTGDLNLCLFGDGAAIPLRPYLQSDGDADALTALIRASVAHKPRSHSLRDGSPGATSTLAAIGG